VHGTLSAVADRLKILQEAKGPDIMLARQVILNCGSKHGYGNGCHGGESSDIFEFMRILGLPDEGCYNYLAEEQGCPSSGEGYCINCMMFGGNTSDYKCWAVEEYVKYHVAEYGYVSGEASIMSEVLARGPVTCGLVCPDEFVYNYKGGIFHYRGNQSDVDHDVEVVGWGEEDGVPYWLVRNSWGSYWGENGFFRIVRGKNNLRIEEMCAFAIVENHEQKKFLAGHLQGSMFGVTKPGENQWRYVAPDPNGPIPNKNPKKEPEFSHKPPEVGTRGPSEPKGRHKAPDVGTRGPHLSEVEVLSVSPTNLESMTMSSLKAWSWSLACFLFSLVLFMVGLLGWRYYKREAYEYQTLDE